MAGRLYQHNAVPGTSAERVAPACPGAATVSATATVSDAGTGTANIDTKAELGYKSRPLCGRGVL